MVMIISMKWRLRRGKFNEFAQDLLHQEKHEDVRDAFTDGYRQAEFLGSFDLFSGLVGKNWVAFAWDRNQQKFERIYGKSLDVLRQERYAALGLSAKQRRATYGGQRA